MPTHDVPGGGVPASRLSIAALTAPASLSATARATTGAFDGSAKNASATSVGTLGIEE